MSTAGADNFADATDLPFGTSSDPTPTASLTAETGEQFYYGYFAGRRTAWWRFTAPRSCSVNVDFLQTDPGSDPNAIQVYLAVWTGDTMGSLTGVNASDACYDNTDTAHAHLPELDFDATEGTTYLVQVSLDDSSLDLDLVLRVCESQFPWTGWEQRSDYQLTENSNVQYLTPGTPSYSAHRDGTYPKYPADERSDHLEDFGKKLVQDPKTYDQPGNQPATNGIVIATDNFADPAIYQGDIVEAISAVKINDDAAATYRYPWPSDFYRYNWQWQSNTSTVIGLSYGDWGIQSYGLQPYISLTVGFHYVDGITEANWNTQDQWTINGTIEETAIVGTDGFQSQGPKALDMSHLADDRIIAWSTHIQDIAVQHGLDLESLNVYAVYSPGSTSYATITFRPPLIRYQDKVLILDTPPVTYAPPLRQWPRNDALGASSARAAWSASIQASNRKAGGYL